MISLLNERTFYIFKINKIFTTLYDNKSYNLYNFLKNINKSRKLNLNDKYKIYNKIIKKIDNKKINKVIYEYHLKDVYYKKINNIHYIVNKQENSEFYIYNSYIKIKFRGNFCSFIEDLKKINEDLFIVDFKNNDYFFLKNLILK